MLPKKNYTVLDSTTIASLLRHVNSYTKDLEGDAFGLVYGSLFSEPRSSRGSVAQR